jgi:hypothetical protein
MSPNLIAIALGFLALGIWLTVVQATLTNYTIKRLENPMATAINAKLSAQVDALLAEHADLKAKLAAPNPDTQALADETAAEQAISDKLPPLAVAVEPAIAVADPAAAAQ